MCILVHDLRSILHLVSVAKVIYQASISIEPPALLTNIEVLNLYSFLTTLLAHDGHIISYPSNLSRTTPSPQLSLTSSSMHSWSLNALCVTKYPHMHLRKSLKNSCSDSPGCSLASSFRRSSSVLCDGRSAGAARWAIVCVLISVCGIRCN